MTFLDRLSRAFAPTVTGDTGAFLELKMPVFEPAADAVARPVEENPEPSAPVPAPAPPMIEPTNLAEGIDFAAGEELDMGMDLETMDWGSTEVSASVADEPEGAAPEQYGSIDLELEISLDDAVHHRAA